jgi:hypothetical protein
MAIAINQVAGVAEPLRRYLWEVYFVRTPSDVSVPPNFNLKATSTRIPGRSFERIEMNYLWMTWAVHGRETADKEIELEFWETTDIEARNVFMTWLDLVGRWQSGEQRDRRDITGDIELKLLDGLGNPVRVITLYNAFILSVEASDVRYDANEVVTFTARFWYDYFEET